MGLRWYGGDNITLADPLGETVATAATVSALSVTEPVILKYDRENTGNLSAWAKFVATEAGAITFDAALSYNMFTGKNTTTSPSLLVNVMMSTVASPTYADLYTEAYSGNGITPENTATVQRGVVTVQVEPGKTYWIMIREINGVGNTVAFLRVSDYGAVGRWIQPADTTIGMQPAVGTTTDVYHPITSNISPSFYGPRYKGTYSVSRSFGGYVASDPSDPTPFPAGPQCVWRWGRRGNYGSQWWSKYGGADTLPPGMHTYSWNGTDPYDSSIPGYGTCRVFGPGTVASEYDYNGLTGIAYEVNETDTGFYYYNDTYAYSWGTTIYTSFTTILNALNQTNANTVVPPTDPTIFTTEIADGDVQIVDFQYAFDEYKSTTPSYTGYTEWFVDVVTSSNDTESGYWGPNRAGANGTLFQGGADGPEGFDARSTNLGSYLGGMDNWRSLNIDMVNAAIAAEKNWPATDPYLSSPAGLRWVGIHPSSKHDSLPDEIGTFDGVHDHTNASQRVGQHIAIQVVARPKPYRTVYYPDIPEVEEITGSLTGKQDINRAVFRYRGTS